MPVKKPAVAPTPGSAPAVVVMDSGAPDGATPEFPIPGVPRDAFHYGVHWPTGATLVGGEWVADVVPIVHTAGVNGATGPGRPGVALDRFRQRGGVVLPHAFPCRAFGEDCAGYLTKSPGTGGDYYHDVWHRPEMQGRQVFWRHDPKGWLEFRQAALRYVLDQKGLDAVPDRVREFAERALRAELDTLSGRDDAPSVAKSAEIKRILGIQE